MELGLFYRAGLAYQPMFSLGNCSNPNSGDGFSQEASSLKRYSQDLHHAHHFPGDGSSSIMTYGFPIPRFDQVGTTASGYSKNLRVFESKPFVENGGDVVMESFQSKSLLNYDQRTPGSYMAEKDISHQPQNLGETESTNLGLPYEAPCIVPADNGLHRKVGLNKRRVSVRKTGKLDERNKVVKAQWTNEEDRVLVELVKQYGMRKWSYIAQQLNGRIGKQCRERWYNHLRPDIKKEIWTEEEDRILVQAHAELGNKWAEIAKRLPGRTENSIKNHWNATKRKQLSKRQYCRGSKYAKSSSLLQDYIKSLAAASSAGTDYIQQDEYLTHSNMPSIQTMITSSPTDEQETKDYCAGDRLVPAAFDLDFDMPDYFSFDAKLLDDRCSIESLFEEMLCVSVVDEKSWKMERPLPLDCEAKREMDLVEMITQGNH
ncbi:PREDICTED: transcription factor MYB98-like [Nelumbo nucifera]|uniref:Transcription factor MYB98-like n=2 Tax=Nelumbo nucifera TaxID=4432 RepID=A0A822YFG2_NELNU|nr:PREDICTED: transcription factor MYB98-like [Nelumbo nucifera]DAD30903.1 TPA_asm: hypothetical protein HUJ06_009754 [Nelumbo nucifera]